MFHGYKKAVTFSYDDGVTQDQRLIETFDKYGLTSLNYSTFGDILMNLMSMAVGDGSRNSAI